jgi:hypothetical protein
MVIAHCHRIEKFKDMRRKGIVAVYTSHNSMFTFKSLSTLEQAATGPHNYRLGVDLTHVCYPWDNQYEVLEHRQDLQMLRGCS